MGNGVGGVGVGVREVLVAVVLLLLVVVGRIIICKAEANSSKSANQEVHTFSSKKQQVNK